MTTNTRLGVVAQLRRYPVKSLLGEELDAVHVEERGVEADRAWAVYTEDGGIGSGKTSRRFRHVDGLLRLRAVAGRDAPSVVLPDGRALPAGDPATDAVLSGLLGRPVALRAETTVSHFDDSPLHLVTTAALRALAGDVGREVEVERFRPNVVVGTDPGDPGHPDDGWHGRELALGPEVVVRVDRGMPRCVMVTAAQASLPRSPGVLRALGPRDAEFGVQLSTVRPGLVRRGDEVRLLP